MCFLNREEYILLMVNDVDNSFSAIRQAYDTLLIAPYRVGSIGLLLRPQY